MADRKLRRFVASELRRLGLSAPFTRQHVCDAIARDRGRRLYLHPLPDDLGPDRPTGLWIATDRADHIMVDPATSRPHQDLIIYHEIGHIILHDNLLAELPAAETSPDVDQIADVVRQVQARAGYTRTEEHEAETVARLIWSKATRLRWAPLHTCHPDLGRALGVDHD
ncbi:hypothetical protein [Gandjariella thermophila]|uniref:IrrE N-terminal-like domain-containing protein n=1 Tax=Gandjariella thermophila TaxID=1931992 RepID=A0A4D4JGU5_9PSEU|nr:hypothetical protein [Gandjariella thermophila]GDY33858.1 hypothetical protein GTS_54910 [Gandjariella thermophila]